MTKITITWPNAEKSQRPNSTKKPTWYQGCLKRLLFQQINALKKQLKPAKAENRKMRKIESLLSFESNLTNSSDEMEEYFLLPLLSVDIEQN